MVYLRNGFLWNTGAGGLYWSSSGNASFTALDFGVSTTDVYPSFGPDNRFYGFSLRCLQE